MKLLKSLLYWLFICLALIIIFAESYDSLGNSAYFVTLLFPVVYFTSYLFNNHLIPKYLLKEQYGLFAVYALCTVVLSIYLETWAVSLAFILVAKFDYSHMIPVTTDVFQLAITMYAIVLLNAVIRIFGSYRHQEQLISKLETAPPPTSNTTISIVSQRKNRVLVLDQITYVESMADYVQLHLNTEETVITKKKISHIESELGNGFLRIHRSFIINLSHVGGFGQESVEVAGKQLTISRTYKVQAIETLKALSKPGNIAGA